jgi:hypothetical protein
MADLPDRSFFKNPSNPRPQRQPLVTFLQKQKSTMEEEAILTSSTQCKQDLEGPALVSGLRGVSLNKLNETTPLSLNSAAESSPLK